MAILAIATLSASAVTLTAAARPTATGVHLTGRTALAKVESSTVLIDRGTITGSPVGSGRITLVYTLNPGAGVATTTFTIVNARGTVTGRARSRYVATRLHLTFTGVRLRSRAAPAPTPASAAAPWPSTRSTRSPAAGRPWP